MIWLKRLFELRIDNDLTQEQVAKIINTTKQNYGHYESGKRQIKIEDLLKLCEFYKVTPNYMFGVNEKDESGNKKIYNIAYFKN